MNYVFYHALTLTKGFFHAFRGIRYKGVPVARAMFYPFHRDAVAYYTKNRPPAKRGWQKKQRHLYKGLIANEPLARIAYPPKQSMRRIIFSPYACQGIPLNPREAIICGVSRDEKKHVRRSDQTYCVPSEMAPLNKKSYAVLVKKIRQVIKSKHTQSYFKRPAFQKWMFKELRNVMRTIDGLDILYRANNIKGVVMHSTVHPLGYLAVHMAKQRGLKTMVLQYGINDDYQLLSTYPHYYVAWGVSHQKRLTRYGVPASKFRMLGNARFDSLFRYKAKSKKQLAKLLRFPHNRMLFVYAEQPLKYKQNKLAMTTIIRALKQHRKRVMLLVKEHPRQKKRSVSKRELRTFRFIRIVRHKHVHLYDLIKNAAAVFTQFSTVGTEAILLNRALIALSLFPNTDKHEFSYYAASAYITSARNQRQLNKIISLFVKRPQYRRNILRRQQTYRKQTYAGSLSGVRIKKFINVLMK